MQGGADDQCHKHLQEQAGQVIFTYLRLNWSVSIVCSIHSLVRIRQDMEAINGRSSKLRQRALKLQEEKQRESMEREVSNTVF